MPTSSIWNSRYKDDLSKAREPEIPSDISHGEFILWWAKLVDPNREGILKKNYIQSFTMEYVHVSYD